MDNSNNSENQNQQSNPEPQFDPRGEIVEIVKKENFVPVNDVQCHHEKLIKDPTETDFDARICANPRCGAVFLYDLQV